jgi:hypothetical protein
MTGMEPQLKESQQPDRRAGRFVRATLVVLAAATGLGLMTDSLMRSSATYDEVLYLSVASHWWRTGDQAKITRAGSPLTFWKLQQVPLLWTLDRLGHGDWIDRPDEHELILLPLARIASLWIWLVAMGLVVYWSRRLYGPHAMVVSAWWFALSPNLLAHGPLITMETPIIAAMTGMMFLFWIFLRNGDRRAFAASAILGGLAFSCKFTAVVAPPIFGLLWCLASWRDGDRRPARLVLKVAVGMIGFTAIMAVSDVVITGGATLTMSAQSGDHPSFDGKFGPRVGRMIRTIVEASYPQDWVGFVRQSIMQRSGAPSYLFGEVHDTGWRYYYLVALAVKVPLVFWLVIAARAAMSRRIPSGGRDWVLPVAAVAFVALASVGSTRNLGIRYLLPVAPLAIVWISGLAEGNRWSRRLAYAGLAAQALAIASIHPYELTYFNALAGGPVGGRRILSDSNLDWGQGLKPLARLQREHHEFRDLTFFYFGDNDPALYGIAGQSYTVRAANANEGVPTRLEPRTTYLAVSASLQWGAYAPPGLLSSLKGIEPVRFTDDATIAIYRTDDILEPRAGDEVLADAQASSIEGPQTRRHDPPGSDRE